MAGKCTDGVESDGECVELESECHRHATQSGLHGLHPPNPTLRHPLPTHCHFSSSHSPSISQMSGHVLPRYTADPSLTRVNQQRASERSAHSSRTGTPTGGPGAGFAGPGAGLGPGSGYAGSGPGSGFGGRGSPFPRPGSDASGASQYSESPFGGGMSSGMGGQAGPSFGAYGGVPGGELEQHNEDLLSGLMGKVNVLKDVSGAASRSQLHHTMGSAHASSPRASGGRCATATSSLAAWCFPAWMCACKLTTERHVRVYRQLAQRDVPAHDADGQAAGVLLVLLHGLPAARAVDLHHCVVATEVASSEGPERRARRQAQRDSTNAAAPGKVEEGRGWPNVKSNA